MTKKILVIEDDPEISSIVKEYCERKGYDVHAEANGKKGLIYILSHPTEISIILLDINLPDLNGLEMCKYLRELRVRIPIIILTQDQLTNTLVTAYTYGADDYLRKPFDPRELEARIKYIIERKPGNTYDIIKANNFEINISKRQVLMNGREIRLRRKEFDLLVYFTKHLGEVLTRENILSHVWAFDAEPLLSTVDVHVSFLRKKLEGRLQTKLIETVHGVGYKMRNLG